MQGPDDGRGKGPRFDSSAFGGTNPQDGVGTGEGWKRDPGEVGDEDSFVTHGAPGPFPPADEEDQPLPLDDDGERLPWLEANEEDGDEGVDTARIVAFVLIALLVLALVLGVAWFAFRSGPEPEIAPDGSLIEAPEEPFKSRPEDPGGREVEGTGDQSFSVAEGEGTEARIGEAPPPPTDAANTQPASESAAVSSGAGGVAVQVGAFSTREGARNAWVTLRGRHQALQGVDHRIVEGRADSGTIYRLQAMPGNRNAADTLCRSIRSEGGDCQVKG